MKRFLAAILALAPATAVAVAPTTAILSSDTVAPVAQNAASGQIPSSSVATRVTRSTSKPRPAAASTSPARSPRRTTPSASTSGKLRTGSRWLYATFVNATANMWLLTSNDLKNWHSISTNHVYDDPDGLGVHDPSILRHSDGKYYVAYTNNQASTFAVAVSSDLVNWSLVQRVSAAGISGIVHTWAPEWFVDTDGSVHIFFAANTLSATNAGFALYEIHPSTAGAFEGAWSSPVAVTGKSLPSNMIDPFVIKIGSIYYIWYTNGSAGLSGGTTEYMTSSNLTSGYTVIKSGNWTGWGGRGLDGPAVVQTGPTNWIICVEDSYYASQYKCGTSADNFATVSALTAITAPVQAQHGTIISLDTRRTKRKASGAPIRRSQTDRQRRP